MLRLLLRCEIVEDTVCYIPKGKQVYGILGQVSGDVRKRRKADISDDVFVTTRSSRCIGLSVTQEEIDGDIIFDDEK